MQVFIILVLWLAAHADAWNSATLNSANQLTATFGSFPGQVNNEVLSLMGNTCLHVRVTVDSGGQGILAYIAEEGSVSDLAYTNDQIMQGKFRPS